ncbi:MAG: hypothetical protein ACR2G0_10645 [Chthoniobacterales bacterium]
MADAWSCRFFFGTFFCLVPAPGSIVAGRGPARDGICDAARCLTETLVAFLMQSKALRYEFLAYLVDRDIEANVEPSLPLRCKPLDGVLQNLPNELIK